VILKYCPQCAGLLEERRLPDEQLLQPVCTRCGHVLWQNPKPTASGLITRRQKRQGPVEVLLVRRAGPPREGCWDCPGGFIDPDEHPEDALRRELREELGVRATIGPLVGIYMDRYGEEGESILNIYYRVPTIFGTPTPASDVGTASWFPLDRLPDPLAFGNNRRALHALANRLAGEGTGTRHRSRARKDGRRRRG
jgi:ADP-ribose pyrophosphatase YjhB (NUDIX family)